MPTGVILCGILAFALIVQMLNTLCNAQHEGMQANTCAKHVLGIPVLRLMAFKGHLPKANFQKACMLLRWCHLYFMQHPAA